MTHDRDYYRSLRDVVLVDAARREGINPEMAVALAERLADKVYYPAGHLRGCFAFNQPENTDNA
ncbi:MAG TPA: hypothetical protein VFM10_02625 [Terriglobales bacterium]|nr:hypothetical protein [Terriglobales bacterium]